MVRIRSVFNCAETIEEKNIKNKKENFLYVYSIVYSLPSHPALGLNHFGISNCSFGEYFKSASERTFSYIKPK